MLCQHVSLPLADQIRNYRATVRRRRGKCGAKVAIYHFTVKVISRGHGRSAIAAAFYRAGERFVNQEHERTFDYTYKSEVIHSEIILPEGAPQWMKDRQQLWKAVEAREQRRDAQLAREVEFALPQELSRPTPSDSRVIMCRTSSSSAAWLRTSIFIGSRTIHTPT